MLTSLQRTVQSVRPTFSAFRRVSTGSAPPVKGFVENLRDGTIKRADGLYFNPKAAEFVVLVMGDREAGKSVQVIIYEESRHVMSSSPKARFPWVMRFNHADKWTDPLMGWDSASNEIEQTALHLRAATKEEAVRIAVRNGWVYEVMPAPDDRPHEFKTYAYNFLPEGVQEKLKTTPPRRSKDRFKHSGLNEDHWVNMKHTAYGNEAWNPDAQRP